MAAPTQATCLQQPALTCCAPAVPPCCNAQIDALLACTRLLLEQLDARITAWNVDSVICDIFVDIVRRCLLPALARAVAHRAHHAACAGLPCARACCQSKSFELYTSFVNNFDRANHYARKLMNNNEGFQKFVAVRDPRT